MSPYRPAPYQVDVVIRGWKHLDLLRKLLESLSRVTVPINLHRVIYVDNGSDYMHLADLMADYPDVTFLRLPFNHGSVRAINLGLHVALTTDAPFILLMDNDTEIPEGDTDWLRRLVGYLDNPAVGAAGCVTDYASLLQNAEAVPDRYMRDWKSDRQGGTKELTASPMLVSFAMLLRKEAVRQVGFFDEQFEPGNGEDFDYSLRLVQAGWKCVIADSVWIKHVGSQTFKELDFPALLRQATVKLLEKYGEDKLRELGVNVRRA